MRGLLLPVVLGFFPLLLGMPWMKLFPGRRLLKMLLCWPTGYFLILSLFEMTAFPFTWLKGSFFDLAPVYTGMLAIAGGVSFFAARSQWKTGKKSPSVCSKTESICRSAFCFHLSLTYWEWLYLSAFLVIVFFQVFRTITWDMTFMNYDDYDYVARAADALAHGSLLGINPSTGLAQSLNIKRVMQGSILFPAWLSWISGIPVTTMTRTVLETVHLLMAYAVFSGMAMVLFPKRENSLIFLLLLSLLFLMGHYSHYSPTFRLLGPNYQGKGTLAVVFSPLIFTLLMMKIPEQYDRQFGLLLFLFSLAAVAMTLFGAAVMIADVGLPVILSLFRKPRRWKNIGYILWASVFPLICGAAYLLLH